MYLLSQKVEGKITYFHKFALLVGLRCASSTHISHLKKESWILSCEMS